MSDNKDLKPQFTRGAVDIISRKTMYDGFFQIQKLRLRHRLYRGGWGGEMDRELFVRGHAVGVLLYDPERHLVALAEQFRVGALERENGPWCLEVVAGMVEEGESLEDVARRELQEEAGLEVQDLHFIRSYLPSPGGTCERMHLFCACADLHGVEGYFGLADEHEDIRLRVFPLDTLLEAVASDDSAIDNAASIISLQWLQLNRERLQR
ncbi:NUDIX domain-containing protein [Microbulbifer hydrolyticus]|uniref:ADP-ribose pyrophosphatase n=1 Tax=Microbulbifer hydrolyticus TaxID=48074 RepID=A0A6P1TBR4_9GAMM|nr:NUDIX domain-containing protein [Microbulbifer hydrolyticus]MBB5211114.1 ADP-ribose pyrophosphatase [Microbulbifer hydrolyticus]QHQ38102.1 NUDIX domain-containing protein [Microbulbifer hydrolyticus]